MTGPAGPEWGTADAEVVLASDTEVVVLGTPCRVATTSAELGRVLHALLEPFVVAAPPAPPSRRLLVVEGCGRHDGTWCVHRGGEAPRRAADAGGAVAWVLADLNATALDGYRGFAVHAGVVSSAGRAVAFPAPSGGGKSTLTAAAVVAGFDYVSDEALCVDFDTRHVVPYPRALVLSPWSREHAGLDGTDVHELAPDEVAVAPARLGVGAPSPELRLSDVVVPVRRPGPPALVATSSTDAIALLLEFSFNHYKRPEASFRLCAELARDARAWRLELSDPAGAASLLLERLAPG